MFHLYTYVCNACRGKVFNEIQDFIHFNLSLSLTMGLITFVSGIETANDNDVRFVFLNHIK